jgi:hypothetical protein
VVAVDKPVREELVVEVEDVLPVGARSCAWAVLDSTSAQTAVNNPIPIQRCKLILPLPRRAKFIGGRW